MLKITKFFSILVVFMLSLNCNSQVIGVGINTNDPKSTLDINGNLSVKVVTIPIASGDTSIQSISDGVYISVNPQVNDQEFRLPAAGSVPGRIYFIRNISTLTARLTTSGGVFFTRFGDTFSGATDLYMYSTTFSSDPMFVLKNSWRNISLISDGTNWTVFN